MDAHRGVESRTVVDDERQARASVVKISLVVAVYNPGPYLQLPIGSFARQTMPTSDFEVIFVNDGSTDGSGRRLDQLSQEHPNVRVIHIPNSGWPGRPRNLGIDAAAGRYILFVDHDDWIEPDALDYLWDVAEANEADVVVAREIGHGFGVPRRLFRRTIPDARLGRHDLLALLTPHKLFRRSMLLEHGIRFPEGRRRLEDNHFVTAAYFHARRITVVGDRPVYHWGRREAGTNASHLSFDPHQYYDNLGEVLDLVDAHTEPGPLRDAMYAHWLQYKMVHKVLRPRFRDPSRDARYLYGAVRRFMVARVPQAVDRRLPVGYRLVARAIRSDRFDLVAAAAHLASGMRLDLSASRLVVTDRGYALTIDYALCDHRGQPIRLRREDGRLVWMPPGDLVDGLAVDPESLVVDEPVGEIAVVVRQRGTDRDHDAPVPLEINDAGGETPVAGSASLPLDVDRLSAGSPLPDGTWDVIVHVEFGGFRASRRVPAPPLGAEHAGTRVRPYATKRQELALRIGTGKAPPRPTVQAIEPDDTMPERVRAIARRVLPPGVRAGIRRAASRFMR